MKNIRIGDIFSVKKGIIVHGCNALGVMNAGVAKIVKELYPKAYEDYLSFLSSNRSSLGKVCFSQVSDDLIIANAITQYEYGRKRRYVNYEAVASCFEMIGIKGKEYHVHYPMIGAGLGGGNWNIISTIIDETLIDLDHTLWIKN